jgi:hypothetical protein
MMLAGVAVAVYAVADSYLKTKEAIGNVRPEIQGLNKEIATFATMDIVPPGIAGTFQMLLKGFLNAAGGAGEYKEAAEEVNTIGFESHVDKVLRIQNAWTNAWNARALYETGGQGGGGFTMTTPIFSEGGGGGGGGGSGVAKTVSGMKALTQNLKQEATKQLQLGKLTNKLGLSEGLASQILGGKNPIKTAKKIIQGTQKAANKLQNLYNKSAAGQNEMAAISEKNQALAEAAASAAQAQAETVKAANQKIADDLAEKAAEEAAILAEKERVYDSFLSSVKQTFGQIKDSIMGAFTLKDLGSSTNAIARNMEKLLVKVRSFATNVSKLSSMGLDPALLQQVISAGPVQGAKLAAALVAGGAESLGQINKGFEEFGALSSQIATTGTTSQFGNAAQQSIYNIQVDGGVGSGSTIGKAIVDAIKAYEKTSGAVWQGA